MNGHTCRRWETGERRPEVRFRKHLVLVFGLEASGLGLLTSEELSLRPCDDEHGSCVRRLLIMSAGLPESFTRQQFVRGVVGFGLLPLIAPLDATAEAADTLAYAGEADSGVNSASAAAYAEITAAQRALYWSAPPQELLNAVAEHTRFGVRLMQRTSHSEHRRRLAFALTESALLSARLAFFDLRDADRAGRFFDTAREASLEARDHALSAAVLAHNSFIPGFAHDKEAALPLIAAAHAHAKHAGGKLLRSWVHSVSAEIAAKLGEVQASLRSIGNAQDALVAEGGNPDPVWLDFYDESRLHGFAASAQLAAGRYAAAARNLTTALEGLGPHEGKQHSVLLLDLALAYAQEDADRSAAAVADALESLQKTWYGTAAERIPSVLTQLSHTPHARMLEDRVRALTSTRSV
ncbi:XRE family transcriptional regulator [Saccharopolyspora phatthalungensis]|uniref:Transcriptional regulator n=1 Tax=Saccharopolyspora phatthalungensis TaxID=664693 RepID=A0A840QFU0_9PSEU|nr:XRE family transcriptional regulator [Saccharopolyspora phatthalungensis]MBB5159306.1 hypothetical protein [Saccharopolyspora phatthalungensis]